MESKLRFANVPTAFKDYRLKEFNLSVYSPQAKNIMKLSCKAIKTWLDRYEEMKAQGQGLYLFSGTKGNGKTMMSACIANELIYEKHEHVKFATSMQILNEIKATWNRDSTEFNSESQLLASLVTADVLIIDDFGTEKARDWVSEAFYSIINGRYVDKKVTIYTSNMSLNNLDYDERITNRIKERVYEIPFPEESVREAIAKKKQEEFIKSIK